MYKCPGCGKEFNTLAEVIDCATEDNAKVETKQLNDTLEALEICREELNSGIEKLKELINNYNEAAKAVNRLKGIEVEPMATFNVTTPKVKNFNVETWKVSLKKPTNEELNELFEDVIGDIFS